MEHSPPHRPGFDFLAAPRPSPHSVFVLMSRAGGDGTTALERAGAETVKRAVELDLASRFQESLVCYQEGIDLLLQVVKGTGPGAGAGGRAAINTALCAGVGPRPTCGSPGDRRPRGDTNRAAASSRSPLTSGWG